MNKTLAGRLYVVVALALSLTLAAFSVIVAWQLALMHAFISGALAWAYFRPLDLEVWEEVQGKRK